MLVLGRKQNERVVIGRDIIVTVLEARDGRVRLGFEAPPGTPIHREEVFEKIAQTETGDPVENGREGSKFYVECG
jgi:carbon storage regulator